MVGDRHGASRVRFVTGTEGLRVCAVEGYMGFPGHCAFCMSRPLTGTSAHVCRRMEHTGDVCPMGRRRTRVHHSYFLHTGTRLCDLVSRVRITRRLFNVRVRAVEF